MKKKWTVLVLFLLLLTGGCAKLLIPPHIQSVKKLAIVSIYMNNNFYNIKSPLAGKGINFLRSLVKVKIEVNEKQQVITYGLQAYAEKLNTIDNWAVMSPVDIMKNKEYQAFLKSDRKDSFVNGILNKLEEAEKDKWIVPEGMRYVPIKSVVKAGNVHTYGNVKDPLAEMRKNLGQLCKALDVDGIAIIELDMGYKKGFQIGGGLLGNSTKIKPNISCAMVVITKDGEIAMKTPLIEKAGGTRYKAKGAMLKMDAKSGTLKLAHKDGKGVQIFNAAIEKASEGLKETIVKAFSKL